MTALRHDSGQALAQLIEREQWELLALCLAYGLLRAIERAVPDALPDLLELLGDAHD